MAVTGITTDNFLSTGSGLGFGASVGEVLLVGWQFEPAGENAGNLCALYAPAGTVRDNSRELAAAPPVNPLANIVNDNGVILSASAAADNPNDTWFNSVGWYFQNSDAEVWLDRKSVV